VTCDESLEKTQDKSCIATSAASGAHHMHRHGFRFIFVAFQIDSIRAASPLGGIQGFDFHKRTFIFQTAFLKLCYLFLKKKNGIPSDGPGSKRALGEIKWM